MPQRPRLSLVKRRAALLSGDVARHSDLPRSHVADYLDRHSYVECLDELAVAWLEGWDEADRREREGLPSAVAPPSMLRDARG